MPNITTKSARERLAVRRDPYWLKLAPGSYLGFRRGPDTWIARFRDATGRQHFNALDNVDRAAPDVYEDAKKKADAWFKQMNGGVSASPQRGTVREALLAYVQHLRDIGRENGADEAERRIKLTVIGEPEKNKAPDPLAAILVEKLTRQDFLQWRKRVSVTRERRTKRDRIIPSRPRAPQTVNRQVAAVQAGLTAAVKELGYIGNPDAWKVHDLVSETAEGDESSATVFLSPVQRAELIKHSSAEFAPFARGLDCTGARPGELAKATAADFDARNGALTLRHRKGRSGKIKARRVVLDRDAVAFIKTQCRDKLPKAPIFPNPEGGVWGNNQWAKQCRKAIKRANARRAASDERYIPIKASCYSFRHSRISELLQVYGVDPLTVCKQTGTSLAMLHEYYWHLIPDKMREALDSLKAQA
ncbi:MAG TPA: site-specific integrase [Gemmatimonadaceae bacterium]|jgi:integrase|nr:site-specific integrase [Gemmatimonadaceae bacterium]